MNNSMNGIILVLAKKCAFALTNTQIAKQEKLETPVQPRGCSNTTDQFNVSGYMGSSAFEPLSLECAGSTGTCFCCSFLPGKLDLSPANYFPSGLAREHRNSKGVFILPTRKPYRHVWTKKKITTACHAVQLPET